MAKQKTNGGDTVYLVNPAGAIHTVTRDHARARLRTVGWRMAEAGEIAAYKAQKSQRHDAPIVAPWTPEPPAEPELPA